MKVFRLILKIYIICCLGWAIYTAFPCYEDNYPWHVWFCAGTAWLVLWADKESES